MKRLDYSTPFEWQGIFWQAGGDQQQYNGTLKYNPAEGIQLNLFKIFTNQERFRPNLGPFAKEIMHGIVEQSDSCAPITLFRVFGGGGFSLAPFQVQRASVSVDGLILGTYCDPRVMTDLRVIYGKRWESLFFHDAETQVSSYVRESKPVILTKDRKIEIADGSSVNFLWNRKVEDIFYARDKDRFENFITETTPLLEKYRDTLFLKDNITSYIKFAVQGGGYDSLVKMEAYCRLFWEFLLQDKIQILSTMCSVFEEGKVKQFPLLSDRFFSKPSRRKTKPIQSQSINAHSFGSGSGSWEQMEGTLRNWFKIFETAEWQPISQLIMKLCEGNMVFSASDYLALVAAIETFMSLTRIEKSGSKGILNEFINKYKTAKWCKKLREVYSKEGGANLYHRKTSIRPREGYLKVIAESFAEIRNVITHPKSRVSKDKAPYAAIAFDEIKLNKAYALLSALMIKAILLYCGAINKKAIDKFMLKFLDDRASIGYINYDE